MKSVFRRSCWQEEQSTRFAVVQKKTGPILILLLQPEPKSLKTSECILVPFRMARRVLSQCEKNRGDLHATLRPDTFDAYQFHRVLFE